MDTYFVLHTLNFHLKWNFRLMHKSCAVTSYTTSIVRFNICILIISLKYYKQLKNKHGNKATCNYVCLLYTSSKLIGSHIHKYFFPSRNTRFAYILNKVQEIQSIAFVLHWLWVLYTFTAIYSCNKILLQFYKSNQGVTHICFIISILPNAFVRKLLSK